MINERHVSAFCNEDISNIENYEQAINDKTQMWDCHHRLEIQGQFRNSTALLKKCGLYYNVPAWQLIFLTHSEHSKLHYRGEMNPMFGKHHSAEVRKKMSEKRIGQKFWNNSASNKRSKECPGEGWVRGRLKRK